MHRAARASGEVRRFARSLRFVWESAPAWTAAEAVLVAAQGLLPLASLLLLKRVIDGTVAGLSSAARGPAFRDVAFAVCLMAGVSLLGAVFRSLAAFVREAQGQAVTDHMYDVIHAKSASVDLGYYENPLYHDTLHRSQKEAPFRPRSMVNAVAETSLHAVALCAMAALLVAFHWAIAAVMFAAAVPGAFFRMRHARRLYRWQRERTRTERKAWYYSWMLTGEAHAGEIRLFGLGPLFMRRFRGLRHILRRERVSLASRRAVADIAAYAGSTAAVLAAYLFIAWKAVEGSISVGALVMYYQAFARGQEYLRGMLGGLASLYEDRLFLSNLHEFLDLENAVREPARPLPVPRPLREGIAFEGVRFRYPGAGRDILDGIDLAVRPGEIAAVVGQNGAGKTTLVKLLCRLYDPSGGKIALDGVDIRDVSLHALRRSIGVIFQDYARYHLTARENIQFGALEADPSDVRVAEAARISGAGEVIAGLPRGFDAFLGKWFEDGEELSAGEWQKLALARSLVREAPVLVLDEPTSALDAGAEHALFERARWRAEGRAVILISHRISSVRMADRIHVLHGGKIAERGTHDELIRAGGIYARLFESQAAPADKRPPVQR